MTKQLLLATLISVTDALEIEHKIRKISAVEQAVIERLYATLGDPTQFAIDTAREVIAKAKAEEGAR